MNELQREVERIDAGGNAWEDTDEVVEFEVEGPLNVVVPVRLSSDTRKELWREATRVGVGPFTLLRIWLQERPKENAAQTPPR